MNLTTYGSVGGRQGLLAFTADSDGVPLGTKYITRDGRVFRRVKAGAALLVVGHVIQSPAVIANHVGLIPASAAIGDVQIAVALGATAVTENQYAGGWAVIDTTPGLGYAYPIRSHPAAPLSTAVVLTLESDAPIQVGLTGSSRVSLALSSWAGVIQAPVTTLTGHVVGVAVSAIPANEYGWVQTGGPGAVLIAGTPIVGSAVVSPGTAAGAAVADGAVAATKVIGRMMQVGVDATVKAVYLTIDD